MSTDTSSLYARNGPSGFTDWDVSSLNLYLKRTSCAQDDHPQSTALPDSVRHTFLWHRCTHGCANRLFDLLPDDGLRCLYVLDLIKREMDSPRADARDYYTFANRDSRGERAMAELIFTSQLTTRGRTE
ncbi:hypothetical protein EDC04DRAFT_920287 [Pisolithus marmoratus]|nr:hypothetical protein EDC04DRAFT_920287 [Pisolithus marmoratus]